MTDPFEPTSFDQMYVEVAIAYRLSELGMLLDDNDYTADELAEADERYRAWLTEHTRRAQLIAWNEGCLAGHNREHHKNMGDEQAERVWPNPYREDT